MSKMLAVPTKLKEKYCNLNPKQLKCAELIILHKYNPWSPELAKIAFVKPKTLQSWWSRNSKGFKDYVMELAKKRFDANSIKVLEKIGDYALTPAGTADRRLTAEIQGWIKRENEVNVGMKIQLITPIPVRDTAKMAKVQAEYSEVQDKQDDSI